MELKTVGFFTEFSAESWMFENGDRVKVLAKKELESKGDGSPHLIIKMWIPNNLCGSIYPEGKVMEKEFEHYVGRLL